MMSVAAKSPSTTSSVGSVAGSTVGDAAMISAFGVLLSFAKTSCFASGRASVAESTSLDVSPPERHTRSAARLGAD